MPNKTHLTGMNLFFLWFGAAVSVAEILTGGYLAELGVSKGLWAILLGHLCGTLLLVGAGWIGYRERLPAIASMRISFGREGSYLLSGINILQLIGWTAIMIIQAGTAMNEITRRLWQFDQLFLLEALVGVGIGFWVFWGVRGFRWINTIATTLLLLLTIAMSIVLFTHSSLEPKAATAGSFGLGFELSIIMPLSWFPLISDYTSLAKNRRAAVWAPFLGYFFGSTWMYGIGMLGAIYAGTPDPTQILLAARMGVLALAILGLSTVTTTFMDVYSAGISLINIVPRWGERGTAVFFTVTGTLLAMVFPIDRYTDFLSLLGSVFAPLAAILLVDYFIFKRDNRHRRADAVATVSWAIGFAFYYGIRLYVLPIGPTLATILFAALLHSLLRAIPPRK